MRKEEGKFLAKRAADFLANAQELLKKGGYDLAAFNFEQSSQLILKYTLFLSLGDYPRTHSLKFLFKELQKAYQEEKEKIENFVNQNVQTIGQLENAYLTSRYLPYEFSKKEVEFMEKFTLSLHKFLKSIWTL